jgi:hypothetical protein
MLFLGDREKAVEVREAGAAAEPVESARFSAFF